MCAKKKRLGWCIYSWSVVYAVGSGMVRGTNSFTGTVNPIEQKRNGKKAHNLKMDMYDKVFCVVHKAGPWAKTNVNILTHKPTRGCKFLFESCTCDVNKIAKSKRIFLADPVGDNLILLFYAQSDQFQLFPDYVITSHYSLRFSLICRLNTR